MDKLIEYGLVTPGDTLYITCSPDGSDATLVDSKYVDYNGEKLTLNDWGCKVTGWNEIYPYICLRCTKRRNGNLARKTRSIYPKL